MRFLEGGLTCSPHAYGWSVYTIFCLRLLLVMRDSKPLHSTCKLRKLDHV
jgi:hypothetical protein